VSSYIYVCIYIHLFDDGDVDDNGDGDGNDDGDNDDNTDDDDIYIHIYLIITGH
jgi:hypothetical protein